MKSYTLINNDDGNIQHKLKAKNYIKALEEALEMLGWWLTEDSE